MTGVGRVAYKKVTDAMFNGDMSLKEGIASVINACDELEAYYKLQGETVSDIVEIRKIAHRAYMAIRNVVYKSGGYRR